MIGASLALTLAQQAGTVGPWWLELSRYVPYTALLLPGMLALPLACWLGWRWVAADLIALAAVAWLAMGFVWGQPDAGEMPLRLMTYNVKAYMAAERPNGYAELRHEVALHHPDILLAQDNRGSALAAALQPGDAGDFALPHVFGIDQYIIASRYPLRDCHLVSVGDANPATRYAECTVDVNGVALQVATVHFESPRGGLMAARREGLEGADDWERNHTDRLAQARALAQMLRAAPRPLVLAGDLNAPQSSAVIRTLLDTGLRDAFASAGRGYGFSYGQAMRMRMNLGLALSFLRIDHILVSPQIGVTDSFAGNGGASEHRPVIADLLLRRN
ncbi:MAG: endonuclease/exonuclease/phosphatase family protein [Burkholderiales bacterium]